MPTEDKEIFYKIKINNQQGDAVIVRECLMQVYQPITFRNHIVYGSDNPMEWCDMHLKAWDEHAHNLETKVIDDRPYKKSFNIVFFSEVPKGTAIRYFYSYQWNCLFPSLEDWFILHDVCTIIRIKFTILFSAKLIFLIATEKFQDGSEKICSQLCAPKLIHDFIDEKTYLYIIKKNTKFSTVRLNWKIEI